jgi:D-alanyl-D-alanine carboxypeptidase
MTDLRVLQQARIQRSARQELRRRDRRRRVARRTRRTIGALTALAIIVLVFDAVRTNSTPTPARTHAAGTQAARANGGHRHVAVRRALRSVSAPSRKVKPAPDTRPAVASYGRTPDAVQVHATIAGQLTSGLLFDVTTGQYLWARDPTQRLPIASLTKMMTALVVVSQSRPTDRVLITSEALDYTGSGVGLLPLGKHVSELALLYGLLLPSGNDAAIALAQHVAGTQPAFIGEMNAQAAQMGLTCSHFATVSGVVDRDNYSCADDLATIAHAVLTNPVLAPVVASPTKILPFPIKGGKLYLTNNNPLMLGDYAGVDGVKTGFTTRAGLCIVAAARRGDVWLAVVLLHSANWQAQAESLLNAGFSALATAARQTVAKRPSSLSSSSVNSSAGTGRANA